MAEEGDPEAGALPPVPTPADQVTTRGCELDTDPRKSHIDAWYLTELMKILPLVIPQVLAQITMTGSTLVDVIFIGHLGRETLAAIGKATVWLRIFDVAIKASSSGIAIHAAEEVRYNANGMKVASSWFARGVIVTFFVAALCTVGAYFLVDLVNFQCWSLGYDIDENVTNTVKEYGHLVFVAYPAHFLLTSTYDFTSATLSSAYSVQVFASFIALICNICFAYLFIYGDALTGINPSWKGFKGAPIATVCTYYVRLIFAVFFTTVFACYGGGCYKYLSETIGTWNYNDVFSCQRFMHYGVTSGYKFFGMILQSALVLCILLVGSNMQSHGQELLRPYADGPHSIIGKDTAAIWDSHFHARLHKDGQISKHDNQKVEKVFQAFYGVGGTISVACAVCILTIYQLPLNIFNGIAVACADRVSVSFTSGHFLDSKKAALRAVRVSLAIVIVCALPFMLSFVLMPSWVAELFTGCDQYVVHELQRLQPWMAVIVFFDAISTVLLHGVFPEIHATKVIPFMRFLFFICFIPSAYSAAFVFKYGNRGVMYSWCASSGFCCIVTVSMYCYYTTDKIWDMAFEGHKKQRIEEKGFYNVEAQPLLHSKNQQCNIFHAHRMKQTSGETKLLHDIFQSQRDSPSMLTYRAGGCIW